MLFSLSCGVKIINKSMVFTISRWVNTSNKYVKHTPSLRSSNKSSIRCETFFINSFYKVFSCNLFEKLILIEITAQEVISINLKLRIDRNISVIRIELHFI